MDIQILRLQIVCITCLYIITQFLFFRQLFEKKRETFAWKVFVSVVIFLNGKLAFFLRMTYNLNIWFYKKISDTIGAFCTDFCNVSRIGKITGNNSGRTLDRKDIFSDNLI